MAAYEPGIFVADQLGIKDIDGYGHVWYGNYMKFFARGIEKFFGGGKVIEVESLKYKKSVPWGADDSRIETYLVGRPAANRALVFQRWLVGHDADCVSAFCLSQVELPAGVGAGCALMGPKEKLLQGRNGAREPMAAMAVKNLQTGGVPAVVEGEPILGKMLIPRHCFADMVGEGGQASLVDVMDLFEQSRSEVVGGQPGLKAFMDQGLALVVGQIDALVLAQGVPLKPNSTLLCEVTLLRETTERRCFHFQQRVLRPDGAEVARVRVLMCCVDPNKGDLVRVPDAYWDDWRARMDKLSRDPSVQNLSEMN